MNIFKVLTKARIGGTIRNKKKDVNFKKNNNN